MGAGSAKFALIKSLSKMNKLLALAIFLIISGSLAAQTDVQHQEEFITRPFQLSLLSPLGTNGMESGRTINKVSFNLIAGYAAGLDGVEFGGIANLERQHIKGVQMAGFLNYAGGTTEGVQMAGFANINCEKVQGVQFAGFSNVVADSSSGPQFAGFTNISKNHQGLQMAGFGNIVSKRIKGIQLAGFMNVAKETDGSQIAGFLNISQKLDGLQLGVINIVDSVAGGTPVGVFSFVRRGYNRWEIWTNETLHLNTGFKFGTTKFYNILAVGAGFHPLAQESMLGFAYGAGHVFPLPKGQLSLDALAYQLMDTHKPFSYINGKFNQLGQLKLSYDYPGKHLSYFIGPSFNVLVQHNKQSAEEGWAPYAPYTFHTSTRNNTRVQMWAGVQLGVRF